MHYVLLKPILCGMPLITHFFLIAEDESIVVKNEPESVVIPILEEALEDMDQMGKEETASVSIVNVPTSMQGPSHMQGIVVLIGA